MSTTPVSMLVDVRPASAGPPRHRGRRSGVGILFVVVLLGATGALGVHSRTARHINNSYPLSVTYAQVARVGLDVPWRARGTATAA